MKNDKCEFLYGYGREAFEDELKRFRNIEDKSAKYLSFLSIGVVAYTLAVRLFSTSIYPWEIPLQGVSCLAVAITYLYMISSWSLLYRALKVAEMPRLPFDLAFIEKYEPETLPSIQFALMKTCSSAVKHARSVNIEKSKLLCQGYESVAMSMIMLTISLVLILLSIASTTEILTSQ